MTNPVARPPGRFAAALKAIWDIPGNAWRGALAAASVTLWWRFGAVVIVTAIVGALIWVIWKGPWTLAVQASRLDWLGWNSMAGWFVIVVGVVALMDFRLNFRASRTGIEANMAGEHDDPPAPLTVATTTTTTVTPPGAVTDPALADPTMFGGPKP